MAIVGVLGEQLIVEGRCKKAIPLANLAEGVIESCGRVVKHLGDFL